MTVDHVFAADWVAALRSGEYQQGQGCLRSENDCYCVLGVACDLAMKQRLISGEWEHYDNVYSCGSAKTIAFMPNALASMIGVGVDGSIRDRYDMLIPIKLSDGRTFVSLLDANDNGATFEQLAEAIEAVIQGD